LMPTLASLICMVRWWIESITMIPRHHHREYGLFEHLGV